MGLDSLFCAHVVKMGWALGKISGTGKCFKKIYLIQIDFIIQ